MRVRLSKAVIFDFDREDVIQDGIRLWIGGEPGSGKSSCAMSIASQMVEQGGQVIVLDPHGEFGGLWEIAPNRVVRIGYGTEGVNENSHEWCMGVIEEGKSLLLDLKHWAVLESERMDAFVLKFVKDLYRLRVEHPKRCLLVVEECQNFAPQAQMSGQAENVRLFVNVASAGRKFGLNVLLTSQRQSLVDSNLYTQCNVRIFLRTSEFSDWNKRIRKYVPPAMNIGYEDIRKFKSGEALVLSRWTPDARVQLLRPKVAVKKAEL